MKVITRIGFNLMGFVAGWFLLDYASGLGLESLGRSILALMAAAILIYIHAGYAVNCESTEEK